MNILVRQGDCSLTRLGRHGSLSNESIHGEFNGEDNMRSSMGCYWRGTFPRLTERPILLDRAFAHCAFFGPMGTSVIQSVFPVEKT